MHATPTPRVILGREPALWLGLAAAAIQLVGLTVFPLDTIQQGALNAAAAALAGTITAFTVSIDKGVPALVGLLQAAIAVALAFGWNLDPGTQTTIMATVTSLAALVTRQLVTAPVPAKPHRT